MRDDIIAYLSSEVEQRCKLPTNFFGMGCYYHIVSVVKNAEILAKEYNADVEVVVMGAWQTAISLQDVDGLKTCYRVSGMVFGRFC